MSFNEGTSGGWWMIPVFPVCGVRGTLPSSSHQIVWQLHTPVSLEQVSCGENEAQRVNISSKGWQVVCSGAGAQPYPYHWYEPSPLSSHLNGFSEGVGWAFPGNHHPHQNLLPPWLFSMIPEWSQDALTVPFSRR